MRMKLKLYEKWGITFESPYHIPINPEQKIEYVSKQEITQAVIGNDSLTISKKKGVVKVG